MKKNIVIIALLLFVGIFFIYGYIKTSEAEKNLVLAIEFKEQLTKAQAEAQKQMELAMSAAAAGIAVQAEAEEIKEQLRICQSR